MGRGSASGFLTETGPETGTWGRSVGLPACVVRWAARNSWPDSSTTHLEACAETMNEVH